MRLDLVRAVASQTYVLVAAELADDVLGVATQPGPLGKVKLVLIVYNLKNGVTIETTIFLTVTACQQKNLNSARAWETN